MHLRFPQKAFQSQFTKVVSYYISSGIYNNNATLKCFTGTLVQEIHQKYNDWVGQVIRIYQEHDGSYGDHIEMDWVVGSIPVE